MDQRRWQQEHKSGNGEVSIRSICLLRRGTGSNLRYQRALSAGPRPADGWDVMFLTLLKTVEDSWRLYALQQMLYPPDIFLRLPQLKFVDLSESQMWPIASDSRTSRRQQFRRFGLLCSKPIRSSDEACRPRPRQREWSGAAPVTQ